MYKYSGVTGKLLGHCNYTTMHGANDTDGLSKAVFRIHFGVDNGNIGVHSINDPTMPDTFNDEWLKDTDAMPLRPVTQFDTQTGEPPYQVLKGKSNVQYVTNLILTHTTYNHDIWSQRSAHFQDDWFGPETFNYTKNSLDFMIIERSGRNFGGIFDLYIVDFSYKKIAHWPELAHMREFILAE